jgi:hypothetical protein
MTYSALSRRRLEPEVLAAAWRVVIAAAEAAGRTRLGLDFVHSDWCCVVENAADERRCREALAGFFGGDWDEARRTYVMGTADEVAAALIRQCAGIDRVDAYVLTPLVQDLAQLDALARGVAPALRAAASRVAA